MRIMKMIDLYVYSATRHLPEDAREDIARELESNITDMLPEDATEEDVREVLEKLGDPANLAAEYSGKKKYLVGPDLYDSYISVLKLVTGLVAIVLAFIALIGSIINPPLESGFPKAFVDVAVDMSVGVFQGVMQSIVWVTLIFAVLERVGVNEGKLPYVKKKWTVDELMDLQVKDKRKISRGETIFTMFFTMMFAALLITKPQMIGWYSVGGNDTIHIEPLLNVQRLQIYIPVMLMFVAVSLGILVWKYIAMHWNSALAAVNAVYNLGICILLYCMMQDTALFNGSFLSKVAELLKMPASQIMEQVNIQKTIFALIFIGFCIWDSISGFVKSKK